MWVDGTWWVSIGLSMNWQVTVSWNGDSTSSSRWFIVDWEWGAVFVANIVSTNVFGSWGELRDRKIIFRFLIFLECFFGISGFWRRKKIELLFWWLCLRLRLKVFRKGVWVYERSMKFERLSFAKILRIQVIANPDSRNSNSFNDFHIAKIIFDQTYPSRIWCMIARIWLFCLDSRCSRSWQDDS